MPDSPTCARSPRRTWSCSARTARSAWRIRSRHTAREPASTRTGRTWWGNCAWDGFGIVHALGLRDATITAQGLTAGEPGVVFEVAVPAARWWDDIADT